MKSNSFIPLLALIAASVVIAEAAEPAAATASTRSAATPAGSIKAGYLAGSKSGALRFAPVAPTRSTAELPALPATRDPQPTRPPEFPKIAEGPQTIVTTRPAEPVIALFPPSDQSPADGKGAAEMGSAMVLTPQMLVRFFPNGKPDGAFAGRDLSFQIPIRTAPEASSATYTIK